VCQISWSTTLDRKRIYANSSSYPNPNSNFNSNTNPNPFRNFNATFAMCRLGPLIGILPGDAENISGLLSVISKQVFTKNKIFAGGDSCVAMSFHFLASATNGFSNFYISEPPGPGYNVPSVPPIQRAWCRRLYFSINYPHENWS